MQDREVQELGQKLRNALRCTQRDERERGESLILTREGPEQGRRNGERGEQIRDVRALLAHRSQSGMLQGGRHDQSPGFSSQGHIKLGCQCTLLKFQDLGSWGRKTGRLGSS